MLPIPTQRAIALFLGCAGMWLVGLFTRSWAATVLGSGVAILLVAMLAATVPLGRRVRAQRLEFAWWLAQRDGPVAGAVVPHVPFQIRCYVRHRGVTPIELTRVEPIVASGAKVLDAEPAFIRVAPRARNEFSFSVVAQAAGRVVLHGLAVSLRGPLGLFDVPLYFPNALAIKVLPRTVAMRASLPAAMTGLPLDRPGRHRMKRRGGGTELHELREFQPGDPFKSIAWKASAKAGSLLVREVDQEVQQTLMLVLDVCGSMRGGDPGSRKLDFALELAAAQGRAWLDRGDRVGLLTVDGRVIGHVQAGEGPAHLIRIYDALLATTEVVDADLTALDDRAVVDLVARYVRHQDGLDFTPGKQQTWDVNALVQHVRSVLPSRASELPQAQTQAGAELRRFCRERGIQLPHRVMALAGDKSHALAGALRTVGGQTRVPQSIVLVTDLDGVVDYEPLRAAARLLSRRGHSLQVLVPDAEALAAPVSEGTLEHDLRVIYGRSEQRRLREAKQRFGKLGVTVSMVRPGQIGLGAQAHKGSKKKTWVA
jgi:uncharacterized protein (DUF58 family)